MIKEFEKHHGGAICRLVLSANAPVNVESLRRVSTSAYLIDRKTPVYLKYSQSRMSPWAFTFTRTHAEEIQLLFDEFKEIVIGLVCNSDGIAGLTYDEYLFCAKAASNETVSITAIRRAHEKYLIRGSRAELRNKVGQDEFYLKAFGKWVPRKPTLNGPWPI